MSSFLIAFDPGKNGGVAFGLEGRDPAVAKLGETPDEIAAQLRSIIQDSPENVRIRTVVEQVGGYAGQRLPGSAMFNFGASYGSVLGALAVLGLSPKRIPPQVWQKKLDIGTRGLLSKTQWKNKLKATAASLYPSLKITLATADALLLWHTEQTNE